MGHFLLVILSKINIGLMSETNSGVRPDVLNYDDIKRLVPKLDGHEKLVNFFLRFLSIDKVNDIHRRFCDTPGPEFAKRLLLDGFKIKLRIDNEEQLDNLPQGAFITVSNHPLGALDGIALIYLISSRRPEYKVMVNMILNQITAMRPNFIAVDALASDDPSKRQVSINGIRQALRQLKDGEPVGFFPAGAISKTDSHGKLHDRPWQPSILSIIKKAKVPVVPIYFHNRNSWWFDFLGHACWQARSLRLPAEVFRMTGKEMHISVGDVISVEDQLAHGTTPEELGKYLRNETYKLRDIK